MKKFFKKAGLNVISECILYILIIIMGSIVMMFPSFGIIKPIYYASILFYIFAFLSIIAYFVDRKKDDYELLFLSFICIVVATTMFLLQNESTPLVLGTGLLVFTFLQLVNRGYKIYTLKQNKSYIWLIKFIITFLIGFLGILTTFNFYQEVTAQTLMFGYYFITLGIMCLAEPLLKLLIKSDSFEKVVKQIIKEEIEVVDLSEETKSKKKITKKSPVEKAKKKKKPVKKTTVASSNKNSKIKTNKKKPVKKTTTKKN